MGYHIFWGQNVQVTGSLHSCEYWLLLLVKHSSIGTMLQTCT